MSGPACGHRPWDRGAADPRLLDELGLGVPALELASLGFEVFPVARGGKRPHRMLPEAPPGEGGYKHATRDPAQIRAWWRQDRAADIGVATGQRSGLAVPDLDVKSGDDGPGNFARFRAQHGLPMPPAPWARTPSGGFHIWMRHNPPLASRSGGNPLLPGVEVKADGGYVVAPPSGLLVTPLWRPDEPRGAAGPVPVPYTWGPGCCPCGLPEAPPWLIQAMAALPVPPGAGSQGGTGTGSWHGDLPPTSELAARGLPPGRRDGLMQKLACRLWREHGPDGEAAVLGVCRQVFGATDTAASGLDGEPFTWGDALKCIKSARVFITGQAERERATVASYLKYYAQGGAR